MDSSVSLKDQIWFLRVCHHVSNELYHSAPCLSWSHLYNPMRLVYEDGWAYLSLGKKSLVSFQRIEPRLLGCSVRNQSPYGLFCCRGSVRISFVQPVSQSSQPPRLCSCCTRTCDCRSTVSCPVTSDSTSTTNIHSTNSQWPSAARLQCNSSIVLLTLLHLCYSSVGGSLRFKHPLWCCGCYCWFSAEGQAQTFPWVKAT